MASLTPQDIAQTDAAYWAVSRKIRLQSGFFSFKDHEFQMEPMQLCVRRKCYMKGTQLGMTEIEVLACFHGLIMKRYSQGVLYLFPTTDNVHEFSKSRLNTLISSNRESIGKYVKPYGKGTDTASLKKVGDAFFFLRGARLSQTVEGDVDAKESTQMRSIPIDKGVLDELDLMPDQIILKVRGRMGHSLIKEEVYLSNPTLPGFGIDKLFQESDQRHWHRRCGCGEWVCAELTFPDCVKERADGTGYIGCPKCGEDVGPTSHTKAQWVPAYPGKSPRGEHDPTNIAGYRLSQLMSIFNDPVEILNDFLDPPQGNLGDVYKLRLGLPYVATEDKLSIGVVLDCCGTEVMPKYYTFGQCAMGVDVGKTKHVVIGIRTGDERFEIITVARLSDWNDIHDIAKKFNVKSAVIDIRPYEDAARQFQKAEPYRVFLCEYSENSTIGTQYRDDSGIVKTNRTEIFDATHRIIAGKKIVLPRECTEVNTFAKQCCATAKVLETNKRTGLSIYRYRKMGDEHYRNALNYFYLAASGGKISQTSQYKGRNRPKRTINEHQMI